MANKNKLNANNDGTAASAKQKLNKQQSNDVADYSSFKTVLFYCSLIVFLPVGTFFCIKACFLDKFFTLSEIKSNIYSAVAAVVALHFALGLYIYRAYFGGASTSESRKKAD